MVETFGHAIRNVYGVLNHNILLYSLSFVLGEHLLRLQICEKFHLTRVHFVCFVCLVFVYFNILGNFAFHDPGKGALFLLDVKPEVFDDSLKFNGFRQALGKLFIFISDDDL